MLLDSSIIIYAAKPEHPELRRFIILVTRNTQDFDWIEGLRLFKPLAARQDAT